MDYKGIVFYSVCDLFDGGFHIVEESVDVCQSAIESVWTAFWEEITRSLHGRLLSKSLQSSSWAQSNLAISMLREGEVGTAMRCSRWSSSPVQFEISFFKNVLYMIVSIMFFQVASNQIELFFWSHCRHLFCKRRQSGSEQMSAASSLL